MANLPIATGATTDSSQITGAVTMPSSMPAPDTSITELPDTPDTVTVAAPAPAPVAAPVAATAAAPAAPPVPAPVPALVSVTVTVTDPTPQEGTPVSQTAAAIAATLAPAPEAPEQIPASTGPTAAQIAAKLAPAAPVDKIAAARAALIAAGLPTDVVDGSTAVVAKGPCVAARAWVASRDTAVMATLKTWSGLKWLRRLVEGVETLLFFTVTGALGLADAFGGIDLTGLLSDWTGKQVNTGDLIALLSIGGVLLRLITKTPAFSRWRQAANGRGGATDSKVDDPDAS